VTAGGPAVRAFVALELAQGFRERVMGVQARLASTVKGVRWVKEQGLHVTLRFLGPSSAAQLVALKEALAAAARACPATRARVVGVGMFPERGTPRVLWLGFQVDPVVLNLQAACEGAAVRSGFDPEPRGFVPHLTLGRWRERSPRPALPDIDLGEVLLDTLTLFRSELGREGAVYTPLDSYSLARADA